MVGEVFSLVKYINQNSSIRESFDFTTPARNFIFSLMDDEQVLKRDVIRLLDEDLLIIEFNCNWDYASNFLSHLRKICDYSLAQKLLVEQDSLRFSDIKEKKSFLMGENPLLPFVTCNNLFELDPFQNKAFISESQRLTSLNELIQIDSQIFTFPQNNVLMLKFSIQNITKILVKRVLINIKSKNLEIYPENIIIGKCFFIIL